MVVDLMTLAKEIEKTMGAEKLNELADVMEIQNKIQCKVNNLLYYGNIGEISDFCYYGNSGEHYVYIFKHLNGNVFYVGKGKDKRCHDVINRKSKFKKELEAKDVLLYFVAKNVSEKEAEIIELFSIYNLSTWGCPLTNRTYMFYNISEKGKKKYCEFRETSTATTINNLLHQIIDHKCEIYYLEYIQKGVIPTYEELKISYKYSN